MQSGRARRNAADLRGWPDTPSAAGGYRIVRLPDCRGDDATRLGDGGALTRQNRHNAMKALRVTLLVVGVTIIARNPGLAADAAYGEYLASECITCHGSSANASIPALHALRYEEFIAVLKAYRDGTRTNAVMQSVARSLGDAEIAALASYFSGQP
jgi:cytochrome c553